MAAALKFYGNIRQHGGKFALALGTYFFAKNATKHIFPNYFLTGRQGSVTVDVEEMGYAIKLITQCTKDSNINVFKITPFVSEMVEVSSAGFLSLFGHGAVGIPRTFYCDYLYEIYELEVIQKLRKQLTQKQIFSEPSQNENKLTKSFLLSTNGQKFAVVRHLRYLDKNWGIYEAVVSPIFVGIGYISAMFSPRLLFGKPKPVHISSIFGLTFMSLLGSWFLCKIVQSKLNQIASKDVDDFAASLSSDYAEGAVEFYTNITESHKALRVLLGKNGEKQFSVFGNRYDGFIFNKYGEPYVNRIERFQKLTQSELSQSC